MKTNLKYSLRRLALACIAICSSIIIISCSKEKNLLPNNQETKTYTAIFKEGVVGNSAAAIESRINSLLNDDLSSASLDTYTELFNGFTAELTIDQYEQLKKSNMFQTISFSRKIRNNIERPVVATKASNTGWGVKMIGGPFKVSGKSAYILGTGINPAGFLKVDQSNSKSFFRYYKSNPLVDDSGYTSLLASVVAGSKPTFSSGIDGVAAGANVVSIKVASYEASRGLEADESDIISGLNYVASKVRTTDVVYFTFNLGYQSSAVEYAVKQLAGRGIKVVMAAGDANVDADRMSPGGCIGPNMYVIGACDQNLKRVANCNFGMSLVNYEPGYNILSMDKNGTAYNVSGSAAAAAHMAGMILHGKAFTWVGKLRDPGSNWEIPVFGMEK